MTNILYKDETSVSNDPVHYHPEENTSGADRYPFIMQHKPGILHGEIIGKLASSYYCVNEDVSIDALADAISHNKDISAVGIVDDQYIVKGIVLRHELLDIISRRFGRDIYKNKPVKSLMTSTGIFSFNKNIYGVAGQILAVTDKDENRYYILKDENGRFAGIFSTRDVLVFFSEITRTDIILAKTIQSCVVRDEIQFENAGYEIIGATVMAKEVGGDFYSVIEYTPGRWFITVCDVSGKGISASLVSVTIGGMIHLYDFNNGIENFIIKLNEYIFNTFKTERFLTGVFIDYNADTGNMVLYDMGHSFVYLGRNNAVSRIRNKTDNYPIGIIGSCLPSPGKLKLIKGDTLIVCTDGFTEQKNPEGEEFGSRRLCKALTETGGSGLKTMKDKLFTYVRNFRGSQPQNDDMSLVLLHRK